MEGLKQYLIGLPKEELLGNQPTDVLVLIEHAYGYKGLTPPPEDKVIDLFFEVLKEQCNVTGARLYNPSKKEYLMSGSGLSEWTTEKEKSLSTSLVDAVALRRYVMRYDKVLTRLEYDVKEIALEETK